MVFSLSLCSVLEEDFLKYVEAFFPYLRLALQNYAAYQVSSTSGALWVSGSKPATHNLEAMTCRSVRSKNTPHVYASVRSQDTVCTTMPDRHYM